MYRGFPFQFPYPICEMVAGLLVVLSQLFIRFLLLPFLQINVVSGDLQHLAMGMLPCPALGSAFQQVSVR